MKGDGMVRFRLSMWHVVAVLALAAIAQRYSLALVAGHRVEAHQVVVRGRAADVRWGRHFVEKDSISRPFAAIKKTHS